MIKIINFFSKILSIKLQFSKPKRKNYLIFNGVSELFFLKIINKEESETLHVRFEAINLFVLFHTLLKNGFKNLKENYKINFIKYVNPKFVINAIDNDPSFYRLKNIFPDPCYIATQAGVRSNIENYILFDASLNDKKSLNVDYLFVFGNSIKRKIQKNFNFNIIAAGSILNNFYLPSNKSKKDNSVLFISQATMQQFRIDKKIPQNEIDIFNISYEFCRSKNLVLYILPRDIPEKFYRKDLVNGNWEYIYKNNKASHSFLDNHKMIVFLFSTLGYEALARGAKCVSFPYGSMDEKWVKKNKILPVVPFGYPKDFSDTGPFWTNEMNTDLIKKTMNRVFNYSEKEWIDVKKEIYPEIMKYDPNNSMIKKVLNIN